MLKQHYNYLETAAVRLHAHTLLWVTSKATAVPTVCLFVLLNFWQVLCKAARMQSASLVAATNESSSAPQAQWGHRWRRRKPNQAARLGQLQECREPTQVQAVSKLSSNT